MGTSEQLTQGADRSPDLAELVRRPGPFLSLYLITEADVENAAQRSQTRWKTVRADLDDHGVPSSILDEIEAIVPGAHLEGGCLAVIADAERILHVEHGPARDPDDQANWEPLPRLLPIVRWRQSEPRYVVVLTDRTGADLFAFVRGLPDVIRDEVEGEHDVIRKTKPGGWSQRRYQQRAEDSWEQNAEQVADRVTRLVDAIRPEFVAVAGDVRAVQLLRDELPDRVRELVHVVDKEIPRKLGSDEPIPDDFGPDPSLIGASPQELKELGVDSPQQGSACEVLVRSALGTGAALRVLDDDAGIEDGVGALLRWSAR